MPETVRTCQVLVSQPIDKNYDYLVPDGMDIEPGDYVLVPLGPRQVVGVVWEAASAISEIPSKKLKSILHKYDIQPMPILAREFIDWVARYNMIERGSVLKMAVPVPDALEVQKAMVAYTLASPHLNPPPLEGGRNGGGISRRSEFGQVIAGRAIELRKNMTPAESKLWVQLSKKHLGFKFRRQHPIPPYIADFICLEKGLIVEVDGGQHGEQVQYDDERTKFFESKGYKVLRFWNEEVLNSTDQVIQKIGEALASSPLQTSPLEKGGGLRWGDKQQRVVDLLRDGRPRKLSEIAEAANVTNAVIKTMEKNGVLKTVEIHPPAPCRNPDHEHGQKFLTEKQFEIAKTLISRVQHGGYEAFLLDGVTGSGKTETYFEAVSAALKQDKQIMILLPEIALSNAFIDRFRERFGCTPALWHSSLTSAQRRNTWRGIATGETRVVVGARSALFLPYPDLGLIIVDEEHDGAFKQEENGIYNARDMAVVRANLAQLPVILVSATPSLETMQNVWAGKYKHLEMPSRYGSASKPEIHVVDLKSDKPERQHFISPVLKDAIAKNIEKGEQALLFLNRRGYAPLTLCRTCGYRFECPRCTSWLVEHKNKGKLQCHHCGYDCRIPNECPSCHDTGSLAACGPGVERIAEEVKEYFPEARSLILASDITDTHDKITEALNSIHNHAVDIIIGTQIIAKGHHFPRLTVVGIVDADLGLSGGDLRATEKSFHLLHQVAGRAGREKLKGEVYVQTWNPEHRVMQTLANDDRDGFLRVEAEERERAHMPPYTRLAALILAGENEGLVRKVAEDMVKRAPRVEGIGILGPAQAQMYRIRGRYRYRILVRAGKNLNLQKYLSDWLDPIKVPSSIRLAVDIDPQSFL